MIVATNPPGNNSAEHFRQQGFWLEPSTRGASRQQLVDGGARVALIDGADTWTYQQLARAVAYLSAELDRLGVPQNATVLLVAPLRNAAVAAYLAIVQSSRVAVLLDRRSGNSDITHAHSVTTPRVTIAFAGDVLRLNLRDHGPVLLLDDVTGDRSLPSYDDNETLDPDCPAVILFTSGTTGTPKGVIHTINTLRCGAANMATALGFNENDIPFLSSPLASITGVVQVHLAVSAHAGLILEEQFAAAQSLSRIRQFGATIIGGAPVIIEMLFRECERQQLTELPLRAVALGGTAVPESVIEVAASRYGIEGIRVYGSSEAPFSTSSPTSQMTAACDEGFPLPGVEVAIRGGSDRELLVRGPHQFHGYLDPAHNVDSFDGDWVRTGDQGEIVNGRLAIKGRLKEVVARKGMKISLLEIDRITESLSDLGEGVSYGVADPETGERLVLAVRINTSQTIDYQIVVDRLLDAGLAKWKLPEEIVVWTDEFPRTETGKVRRKDVAADAADRPVFLAPRLRSTSR